MRTVLKIILAIIIISNVIACNFAPGSYPYAEVYNINVDESDLIAAIDDFKRDNPQHILPNEVQLVDGRNNEQGQDYWYHIYFYDKHENQIIKCWTRPNGQGNSNFAFVGINQGLKIGNWKMINKDFSHSENKEEKRKFEENFLNKIKAKLVIESQNK
jgi:hypothetical protein